MPRTELAFYQHFQELGANLELSDLDGAVFQLHLIKKPTEFSSRTTRYEVQAAKFNHRISALLATYYCTQVPGGTGVYEHGSYQMDQIIGSHTVPMYPHRDSSVPNPRATKSDSATSTRCSPATSAKGDDQEQSGHIRLSGSLAVEFRTRYPSHRPLTPSKRAERANSVEEPPPAFTEPITLVSRPVNAKSVDDTSLSRSDSHCGSLTAYALGV